MLITDHGFDLVVFSIGSVMRRTKPSFLRFGDMCLEYLVLSNTDLCNSSRGDPVRFSGR